MGIPTPVGLAGSVLVAVSPLRPVLAVGAVPARRRDGGAESLQGLIERIPRTFRYQVSDTGLVQAFSSPGCITGSCAPAWASPAGPASSDRSLAAATRGYATAIDHLARQADLAARPTPAPSARYSELQRQDLTQERRPNSSKLATLRRQRDLDGPTGAAAVVRAHG